MTLTVDWGAVLAIVAVLGGAVAVVRLIVRDEVRKAVNGKFARNDRRIGSLETFSDVVADHFKLRRRRVEEEG